MGFAKFRHRAYQLAAEVQYAPATLAVCNRIIYSHLIGLTVSGIMAEIASRSGAHSLKLCVQDLSVEFAYVCIIYG